MSETQKSRKAFCEPFSIYQIALRCFTPEGTLKAAEKLLSHIAGLGVTHVQLCPVVQADPDTDRRFWSIRQKASQTNNPKNSYRIQDYFSIDPEYGTGEDLKSFVHTAHQNGLKVVLDLVYYHCGPTAVFLAEHPDFVKRKADGTPDCGEWCFPVLNYENGDLREYLWENMCHFVKIYHIDGYRCDVGDKVPLAFWEEGIRRVREIKPDVFMINEGRDPRYLQVFDVNYFYDGCFDAPEIAKGTLPASAFREKWEACRAALPPGGKVLRFIDNHDVASDSYENRIEKRIGADGVEALLVLNYTLDGIPFLFNGYEVIDDLKHNMFANRDYGRDPAVNWANALTARGVQRLGLVTQLHSLRSTHAVLSSEQLQWAVHDAPESVLAYFRGPENKGILVILNLRDLPVSVRVSTQRPARTLLNKGATYRCENGFIAAEILPFGFLVVKQ